MCGNMDIWLTEYICMFIDQDINWWGVLITQCNLHVTKSACSKLDIFYSVRIQSDYQGC